MHHRQAEPGALADGLGGEERIEDARLRVGVHARAAVRDVQRGEAATAADGWCVRRAGVHVDDLEPHLQIAAGGPDGVRRVGGEVQDDLMDLRGVGLDVRVLAAQLFADLDPRRHGRAHQLERLADDRAQRHHVAVLLARAAELQDAAHQIGGALAGQRDGVEQRARWMVRVELAHRERAVAGDRLQHVVEVVRDAAGERAERLELLRAQLRLGGALLARDVDVQQHRVRRLAGFVALAASARRHPPDLALGPLHPVLEGHRVGALPQGLERALHLRHVLLDDERQQVGVDLTGGHVGAAEQPQQ